jgi:DNA repair photolyase
VDVGFTITTLREDVRRMIEPYAPPSKARISAIERLSSSGIKTWIFYGPYNSWFK